MSESSAAATTSLWTWRDQPVCWQRAGDLQHGRRVVLIHGFGASLGHWRFTVPALAPHGEVISLDLLGFGASGKPASWLPGESPRPGCVRYCFDLWAQQVVDLLDHLPTDQDHPPPALHLVGNSIGAMVALTAARLLQRRGSPAAQVILIDCAQRTLDDKRIDRLSALQRWNRPLLKRLVRQRWLVKLLFTTLAQPGFVRQVLRRAYPSGAHIDDELVELLLAPTRSPGACESFRGFINLFNDHLAPDLLNEIEGPVRLLWGANDPWEDPGEARAWAERFACIRELVVLDGLGHCPHDEGPEQVNPVLQRWITTPAQ